MAREMALIGRFGVPRAGREQKATQVFMEVVGYLTQASMDGTCTEPQLFLAYDGSGGMIVVTGQGDALLTMTEGEAWRKILAKSHMIVDGLSVELYFTGEEILPSIQIGREAATELGFA